MWLQPRWHARGVAASERVCVLAVRRAKGLGFGHVYLAGDFLGRGHKHGSKMPRPQADHAATLGPRSPPGATLSSGQPLARGNP
jgi:hypothetical protein